MYRDEENDIEITKQRCKINNAPGEDRTHNLRISLADQALPYKYDALTDCATGAAMETLKQFSFYQYKHSNVRAVFLLLAVSAAIEKI
ncbi:hypothetical protein T02_5212 [Trichinella nativa]|uniref:Uncharacterized protein n=1 Tax=Trichinella nativa TaxID=6335 RepID=A0A0V1L5T5_9BILA|nr:hypothetical protein T02_5212 [Trichinella nativa]